jgi:tRNA threonylcarbamoyladenosine biosynthesis protein TsaE
MELIFRLEDIQQAAEKFWDFVQDQKIFAFHGEMGSGKTTFIRALCDVKKVRTHVASPTFSIINEYIYEKGKIFHIDLFRLKDEDDAIRAGVEDCIYSGAICMVEWAEKAEALFRGNSVNIFIDPTGANERKLSIK